MDMMLLLKASVLLTAALAAAWLLRRSPAATRHALWSVAFAALLALPFLAPIVPSLQVPLPAAWSAFARDSVDKSTFNNPSANRSAVTSIPTAAQVKNTPADATRPAEARTGLDVAPTTSLASESNGFSWPASGVVLVLTWLAGTFAAVMALGVSLLRVWRLARTSDEITDPAWHASADAIGARLGLRRPARLLVHARVGTPMAGGVWRPVIFLPESARSWSADRRDIVLAHELVHAAGRDPLRHVGARLAVALYWFHPLAWLAAREASLAREQACDAAVLALGTRPSDYARILLDFAETLRPSRTPLAAMPMVDRSLLEKRLMAILTDDRPAARRRLLVPALLVPVLTLALASAQPAAHPSSAPTPALEAPELGTIPVPSIAAPVTVAASILPQPAVAPASGTGIAFFDAIQAGGPRDTVCWSDRSDGASFHGSMSMSDSGGRTVIYEQIGTRGADRIIQKSFGGLRVCALAEEAAGFDKDERPSEWPGRARRVILEAHRGGAMQRLEIARQTGGSQRVSWQVSGVERPFDAAAEQWRERMFAALDATWEASMLRGQVSTLRGQISTIRGEESTFRGEISTLRGEISTLHGQISSARGEESTLRGEISTIYGHVSSLRGQISAAQGAISSLIGSRYNASDAERARIAERIKQYDAEIALLERQIDRYDAAAKVAEVERRIKALDVDGKVARIERDIRTFDVEAKINGVEKRIAALDVEGKIAAIEREIAALDADRRVRQIEERRDREIKQLEAAVSAIK
jgi:beta-lactamase regulating signal transducer with metallopeptidase domain/predicted  nucleic acid-binding Zn-ribbon protein